MVRAPGSLLTSLKDATFSSVFFADLKYGDAYIDSLKKPFDAFSARILLAPGNGGLTQLVGVGRVTGKEIGRTEWHRHQIEFNQRFEYLNNGALQFGQIARAGLELAGASEREVLVPEPSGGGRHRAGRHQCPGAGVGPRDYDFGPGLGGTASMGIEHNGTPRLTVQYQPAWIHTLSGAEANHLLSFLSSEASLPVLSHLELVIHSAYYDRLSKYDDGSRSRRRFPELRVFLAYKTAHKAEAAQ